jgi:hypothetical protein
MMTLFLRRNNRRLVIETSSNHAQIGIDPRAASATRALLRLTPCYRIYLRPTRGETWGTPGSLELTGGEYKT